MIGRVTAGAAMAAIVLATGAPATIRTVTRSGTSTGFTMVPLFDARLGTLQSVVAQSTYDLAFGYNYGMATPVGFDHAVSITAGLGAATWQMDGTSAISGGSIGTFSIHAEGNKTFTSAADLAALTGSSSVLTAYSLVPTPTTMSSNIMPRLSYALTFTYDDTIAAVPEPASWMLMIGGFLGIGVALRRRRRRALAA